MRKVIPSIFSDGVKAGLDWLIYRNRDEIKTNAIRAWRGIKDHPLTETTGNKLQAHWESSKRLMFWAAMMMIPAIVFGVILPALALRMPLEQSDAETIRFWGRAIFIGFGTLTVLFTFYVTLKIMLIRGLLVYAITTLVHGADVAFGLAPSIISRELKGAAREILEPIIKLADVLEYDALTIVMGEGTVLMFITVFGINLNLWTFFISLIAVATLVALVVRDRKPPVWLRRAALAMSLVSLVVIGVTALIPSFQTVNGIRHDCLEQYYLYGTPKNGDQVELCKANLEPEIVANLNAFVALKGKNLTAAEQLEFDARETVIKGLLKGEVKKLTIATPPVTPPPPPSNAPSVTPSKSTKAKAASATKTAAKPSRAQELLAEMRKSHDKAAGLLASGTTQ